MFFNLLLNNCYSNSDTIPLKNSVKIEVGGVGLAYSINFERYYELSNSRGYLSWRVGLNYLGSNNISNKTYPFIGSVFGANYTKIHRKKYFSVGITQLFLYGYFFSSNNNLNNERIDDYTFYNTGIMWSKPNRKFEFKFLIGGITDYKQIFPWFALSFGVKIL